MRLGAPGSTVLDVLLQLQGEKAKAKKNFTTIEEWELAFYNFIVLVIHSTELVRDLLAYSSTCLW